MDGDESEIYLTNMIFRGVKVSKGKHLVEFEYLPENFYWYLGCSILGILFLVIGTIIIFIKNKKSR